MLLHPNVVNTNYTQCVTCVYFLQFNVERRDQETRIEVSCPTKPGLMLSTLGTLDMLGLEVEQCVISCFNGFSVKASCCEVIKETSSLLAIPMCFMLEMFS